MHTRSYCEGVLAIETKKQNFKSFCNYDANLTLVITMELKFIFFLSMSVSLYDVISCDVINVKNFPEILRYLF